MTKIRGAFTAVVSPFCRDGSLDRDGLSDMLSFQLESGVDGIVAAGTTGEASTLSSIEYHEVLEQCLAACSAGKAVPVASTGKNSTREAMEMSAVAAKMGFESLLLVDPYYNAPSSLEIRREYVEPICRSLPDVSIIPYIIPGRTGTQLLPQDVAILHSNFPNISSVKEATGSLDNMKEVRKYCGSSLSIMSGDDALTYGAMTDDHIAANGVISVISNIFPQAVTGMVKSLLDGDAAEASRLRDMLSPWFEAVTVRSTESAPQGNVSLKYRNPVPVKSLMHLFGMPSGFCRQPLGRLGPNAALSLLELAREQYAKHPELFDSIEDFFDIDIGERILNPDLIKEISYEAY
ncbi:MAG: 4-hydroxy-tetrahydrodipicolinate synthase [Thermoplasmata archaeon]|nr:4-hydroxy-tetrahydrodipicolinate synthase [Candidatus Sysuiplasma acidicola]MBX8646532.1 4-hydroxy-tetrahydrodipicolinate synthase [Candidatus Sysuiplasma acidicola]